MTVPGQFAVGATGAATYSVPIIVPPGTAGMAPSLSLDYSSQGTDGIVGWQWSLGGLSEIDRCPRTVQQDAIHGGVNFNGSDRFCLDGQRLILTSGTYGADGSQYRTEIDSFAKIIAHGTAGSGPAWFEVHLKSGQLLEFGNTTDSRLLAVGTTTARAWCLDKMTDTKGNYLAVTYTNDTTNGQAYPARIDYTGNTGASLTPYNSVRFTYTARSDITPAYQAGSLQQTTVLLTHIKTYQGANVVYDYQLAYRAGTAVTHSRLTSVTQCDSAGTTCLAPTTFGWQGGTGQLTLTGASNGTAQGSLLLYPGDFNGDGLTDVMINSDCLDTSADRIYFGTLSAGFTLSSMALSAPGADADQCTIKSAQSFDIEPNGLSDMFFFQTAGYLLGEPEHYHTFYYVVAGNTGTALSGYTVTTDSGLRFAMAGDFNGDGRSDYFSQGISGGSTSYAFLGTGTGSFTQDGGHGGLALLTLSEGDFDGDGCTDVYAQGSPNSINYFCNPAVATSTPPNLSAYTVTLGDFNGDGKTDILATRASGTGTLYLSTGTGFAASSYTVPSGWGNYAISVGDFNGDGKDDIILVATNTMIGTSHQLWLSTGSGFTQALDTSNNPITISHTVTTDYVTAGVADWNSDGTADIWLQQASGDKLYTFSYTPELMTSVSNGAGQTTTVTYDRINKNGSFYSKGTPGTYPVLTVDGPLYAVSQVAVGNGIGGTYNVNYSYAGAFANAGSYYFAGASGARHAGFNGRPAGAGKLLGFVQVAATDAQTGIVTTTNYRSDFPYTGLVSSQTQVLGAVTLGSTTNTWAAASQSGLGSTTYYAMTLSRVVGTAYDIDGSALPTRTTCYCNADGTSSYDAYGNAQRIAVTLSDGSSSTTTNTFVNDTTNWILGQLATTATQGIVGASNLTRSACFNHDSGSGLVTRAVVQPATGSCTASSIGVQADYTLDGFGHRTAVAVSGTGITTRSSGAGYDGLGQFATSTTNALGQSDGTTYVAAFGAVATHTDLNGLTTTLSTDTLGRPTLETRPDGTKTKLTYLFCSGVNGGTATCPVHGAYLMQSEAFASDGTTQIGPISTAYYDALGRVIASDTQGFSGATTRVATQYDAALRVSQTSRPYFTSGGTPAWTVYA
ncbi:MAG TPA: FG-GAP-like repeat-containing protein, partial [Rhizomicrobium sp.]